MGGGIWLYRWYGISLHRVQQTGLGTLNQGLGWYTLGEGERGDTSARWARMCLLEDERLFITKERTRDF